MASVYWQILSGVQAAVSQVEANTILRRKLHVVSTDHLPICLVAPTPAGEKVAPRGQQFGKGVWWDYPVLVAYVVSGNRQLTAGLQAFLDTREAIRNALFQPLLSGAVPVFDIEFDPQEAVKFQEYVGSNYDITGFKAWYRSAEKRTN